MWWSIYARPFAVTLASMNEWIGGNMFSLVRSFMPWWIVFPQNVEGRRNEMSMSMCLLVCVKRHNTTSKLSTWSIVNQFQDNRTTILYNPYLSLYIYLPILFWCHHCFPSLNRSTTCLDLLRNQASIGLIVPYGVVCLVVTLACYTRLS